MSKVTDFSYRWTWLGGKQTRIHKEPVGGSRQLQRLLGRILRERAGDPNLTGNSGVFVLCLQPQSTAIPARLSAPQHSRKCAAVGEGTVAIETDACCSSSSPPPHSLLLTFFSPHRELSAAVLHVSKQLQELSSAEGIYYGVNKQTKTLKPVPRAPQKHVGEVTHPPHLLFS